MAKDLFSGHAKLYAAFRPVYPETLYQFIFSLVKERFCAWDCATGNGQVATRLADEFMRIDATDISAQQLQEAPVRPNINYSIQKAEATNFPSNTFDLITVAQALHWFDAEAFFAEAARVGKKECILAVWGYGHLTITPAVDTLIRHFYYHVVGPFWDERRRLIESSYESIVFPFKTISTPEFSIDTTWTLEHLAGYLESWSATQGFIRNHGRNPVPHLIQQLQPYWAANEHKSVRFPLFVKAGTISR